MGTCKVTTEQVKKLLESPIAVMTNVKTKCEKSLFYVPLHNEFIIKGKRGDLFIAYDPDVAVELFNTNTLESWNMFKDLIQVDALDKNVIIDTIRRNKNKNYVVIVMETATTIKVKTIYNRVPKQEEIQTMFNMLKAKEKCSDN